MKTLPEHPFLEAHHVDNLTDAVKSLTRAIAHLTDAEKSHHRDTLYVLQQIATHTEGLPALVELLARATTNGHAEQGDTQ